MPPLSCMWGPPFQPPKLHGGLTLLGGSWAPQPPQSIPLSGGGRGGRHRAMASPHAEVQKGPIALGPVTPPGVTPPKCRVPTAPQQLNAPHMATDKGAAPPDLFCRGGGWGEMGGRGGGTALSLLGVAPLSRAPENGGPHEAPRPHVGRDLLQRLRGGDGDRNGTGMGTGTPGCQGWGQAHWGLRDGDGDGDTRVSGMGKGAPACWGQG